MQDRTTETQPDSPREANGADELHRLSDQELIRRFADQRDEEAFAVVVRRHKAVVFSACRGILRHHQDAEDAFQATFLVLAKKARRVRWRTSLAGWLHVTASRISLKASTRRSRERMQSMETEPQAPSCLDELAAQHTNRTLHEELSRMPERYRAPLVLCYFDGKSRNEAAEELGLNRSQIKWRLERGRHELRLRLRRRGVGLALPAVTVGSILSAESVHAGAPLLSSTPAASESLVTSTLEMAAKFVADGSLGGVVRAQILTLAKGELAMISYGSLIKPAAVAAVALALLGLGFLLAPLDVSAEPSLRASNVETEPGEPPVVGPLFAAAAAPAEDRDSTGDLSVAEFSLLGEEDQLAHLKDALLEFRRRTENISATIVRPVVNRKYDPETGQIGSKVLMRGSTFEYDLRRIGDSYRVSRRRETHGPKEPGVVYDLTNIEGYDAQAGRGKRCSIAPRDDDSPLSAGVISPHRSSKVAGDCHFFQYLGDLQPGGDTPLCNAGSQFLTNLDDAQVTQIDAEGGLVEVRCPGTTPWNSPAECRMVFDLNKGALLMQYRLIEMRERADGLVKEHWFELELLEASQVEEVWIPTRMRVTGWSSDRPDQVTVQDSTIKHIQLDKLTKADLDVDFPPGTRVRNEFTGNRFQVGPDGEQEPSQQFLRGQQKLQEFTQRIEAMLGEPAPELPKDGWIAGERPGLEGKPYLIHFWATWCGPCKNDMPRLKRLAEDGGHVVGLHPAGTPRDEVRQAVEDHGLNYPVLLASGYGAHDDAISRVISSGVRRLLTASGRAEEDKQKLAGYPSDILPYCILVDGHGRVAGHGFLGQELIARLSALRRAGGKE